MAPRRPTLKIKFPHPYDTRHKAKIRLSNLIAKVNRGLAREKGIEGAIRRTTFRCILPKADGYFLRVKEVLIPLADNMKAPTGPEILYQPAERTFSPLQAGRVRFAGRRLAPRLHLDNKSQSWIRRFWRVRRRGASIAQSYPIQV